MKKYLYKIDTAAHDSPAKVLRAVGRGKRVLEVGCASGVQTRILKEELGCAVTGIEVDGAAAAEAAPHCDRVIVGNLEAMDIAEALGEVRFDVILIADVLEHLRDPGAVLARLKAFLVPGGFVLASIPNVVHAGLVLQMALGRFDYRPYGLLDDTHVRFFTLKSVLKLFEDGGFGVVDVDRVIRPIEATEFATHPLAPDELAMLELIKRHNPEWQTYQFIVRATPAVEGEKARTHAEVETQDRLKDAELANSAMARRIARLEDQLRWIESRVPYRVYSALRRLLPRRAPA